MSICFAAKAIPHFAGILTCHMVCWWVSHVSEEHTFKLWYYTVGVLLQISEVLNLAPQNSYFAR